MSHSAVPTCVYELAVVVVTAVANAKQSRVHELL